MSDPDPRRAVETYRRHAIGCDASAQRTMDIRRRAVAWLDLAPGERERLPRVDRVEGSMEDAPLDGQFDAVLFHCTHDVLQSPRALANVFAHVKPGARAVVAGAKHPPAWLFPLRLLRLWNARPYLTTYRGLARPWAVLEPYVGELQVRPLRLGTNYMARSRARMPA